MTIHIFKIFLEFSTIFQEFYINSINFNWIKNHKK